MAQQSRSIGRMEAGDRIRALRIKTGLSIEHTARDADVSAGSLWKIETGRHKPSLATLRKLAAHFGVTLDALAGEDAA